MREKMLLIAQRIREKARERIPELLKRHAFELDAPTQMEIDKVFRERGIEFAFVSNADNLGAALDPAPGDAP